MRPCTSRMLLVSFGIACALAAGCSDKDSTKPPRIAPLVIDDGTAAGGDDHGHAVALDSNLRIVVAGASVNGFGDYDMALWRFLPDGFPDTTFGTLGLVVDDGAAGGSLDDFGYGVAVDASGRIVVTGASLNGAGDYDMVIWRYDGAGALDLTFGTGGIVTHDGAAGGAVDDWGSRVLVDSTWRVLVTGASLNAQADYDMVVWAYDTNGVLDPSFASAGIYVYDGATGGVPDDYGYDIALDVAGNRILVAGSRISPFGDFDMAIWRLTAAGVPDSTFGPAGLVTHHDAAGGNWDDEGFGISIDALGGIFVCGYSITPWGDADMVIWKYGAGGSLDLGFGPPWGHVVRDSSRGGLDQAVDIAVDFWGRVHAAGTVQGRGTDLDMALWRFSPTGNFQKCAKGRNLAGGIGDDNGFAVVYDDINQEAVVTGEGRSAFGDFDMIIGLRRR